MAALALCLGLAPSALPTEEPRPLDEYAVKAAFLYNFAKFVDWPESVFAAHPDTHMFCIYGLDPFGANLDALAGKLVHDRRIAVARLSGPGELARCQLVFLPAAEKGRLAELRAAVAGRPVLLVGEEASFVARGGMIDFFLQGGHVRFEIDPKKAAAAGLHVSSKLLGLARIAEGER